MLFHSLNNLNLDLNWQYRSQFHWHIIRKKSQSQRVQFVYNKNSVFFTYITDQTF